MCLHEKCECAGNFRLCDCDPVRKNLTQKVCTFCPFEEVSVLLPSEAETVYETIFVLVTWTDLLTPYCLYLKNGNVSYMLYGMEHTFNYIEMHFQNKTWKKK